MAVSVSYNSKPVVLGAEDVSSLYPATEYKYCYRVTFKDTFAWLHDSSNPSETHLIDASADEIDGMYDTMTSSDEYEEAQEAFETHACDELGLPMSGEVEFDWRDEGELWIRTNIRSSILEAKPSLGRFDGSEAILHLDEFALHNYIADDRILAWEFEDGHTERIQEIRLEPVGFDDEDGHCQLTDADARELEKRVNAFLAARNDLDCYLHDVAEYTC